MAAPQVPESRRPWDPRGGPLSPLSICHSALINFCFPLGCLPIAALLLFSACYHVCWEETIKKMWSVLLEAGGSGRVVDIILCILEFKAFRSVLHIYVYSHNLYIQSLSFRLLINITLYYKTFQKIYYSQYSKMVPIIPLFSFELKKESPNLAMKTLVIWIKAPFCILESFHQNIFLNFLP